jgi:hypothetical protein
MEILEKIFGSVEKVKLMRLFLFNPKTSHSADTITDRIQARMSAAKRELKTLEQMGLVKRRIIKKQKRDGGRGGRQTVWILNDQFPFLRQLEILLVNTVELLHGDLLRDLSRVGRLKLVIVSGVFTHNPESRVDLLIVGDNLKKRAIQNVLINIESEVGKELRYATFETSDFNYRLSVYDKLIRDILDYPHERLLDKLGVK